MDQVSFDWLKAQLIKLEVISCKQHLCTFKDVNETHRLIFLYFRTEQRHKQETRSAEAFQEQFKTVIAEAARPFLMARTDRFVDELELFLASGLNMEAYDAVYKQRLDKNNSREIGVANESREEEENRRTRVTPNLFLFEEDSD